MGCIEKFFWKGRSVFKLYPKHEEDVIVSELQILISINNLGISQGPNTAEMTCTNNNNNSKTVIQI